MGQEYVTIDALQKLIKDISEFNQSMEVLKSRRRRLLQVLTRSVG